MLAGAFGERKWRTKVGYCSNAVLGSPESAPGPILERGSEPLRRSGSKRFRACDRERVANIGENLGESLTQFFFGAGGDAGDRIARLVVERRYGCEHPLVRNVVEPVAELRRGLIADAGIRIFSSSCCAAVIAFHDSMTGRKPA